MSSSTNYTLSLHDALPIYFFEGLKIANSKHDMVALRLYDPSEQKLPNFGLVKMFDAEKGLVRWVNTSSKRVRENYTKRYMTFEQNLNDNFRRSGVDYAMLSTEDRKSTR